MQEIPNLSKDIKYHAVYHSVVCNYLAVYRAFQFHFVPL